jgi:hypothetical protein
MMSPKWAVKNKIDLDFCARAFFTRSTTEKGKIEKKGVAGNDNLHALRETTPTFWLLIEAVLLMEIV